MGLLFPLVVIINSEFFQSENKVVVYLFAGSVGARASRYHHEIVSVVDFRYEQAKSFSDSALYSATHYAVAHFFADYDSDFQIMRGHLVNRYPRRSHADAFTICVRKTPALSQSVYSLHFF